MIDMLLKKKKRKERKENFTNCFGYDDMQKAFCDYRCDDN